MDSINKNHYERTETNPKILLQKSIILLLSRWYALQMAIENHWGGSDSLQKSHQLAADLFSWFSKSKCCIVFFNSLILFCFLFIQANFISQFSLLCDLSSKFQHWFLLKIQKTYSMNVCCLHSTQRQKMAVLNRCICIHISTFIFYKSDSVSTLYPC